MSNRFRSSLAATFVTIIFLCLSIFSVIFNPPVNEEIPVQDISDTTLQYLVTKVSDGDTIKIQVDDGVETIRLIGVDTPEINHPTRPVECFAEEASTFTRSRLEGRYVTLEADQTQGDTDRYGRLLRYIFLDGENFNKVLIEQGYAHEYTYRVPYKYQEQFLSAQIRAQKTKAGLWGESCQG